MIEQSGFIPYDLGVPAKSLWQMAMEPRPCLVCGKERPGAALTPLRDIGKRSTSAHDDCDRRIAQWQRVAAAVDQDPVYLAAQRDADEAQDAADQTYEARLLLLDLPDWIVAAQMSRHRNREWPA